MDSDFILPALLCAIVLFVGLCAWSLITLTNEIQRIEEEDGDLF